MGRLVKTTIFNEVFYKSAVFCDSPNPEAQVQPPQCGALFWACGRDGSAGTGLKSPQGRLQLYLRTAGQGAGRPAIPALPRIVLSIQLTHCQRGAGSPSPSMQVQALPFLGRNASSRRERAKGGGAGWVRFGCPLKPGPQQERRACDLPSRPACEQRPLSVWLPWSAECRAVGPPWPDPAGSSSLPLSHLEHLE